MAAISGFTEDHYLRDRQVADAAIKNGRVALTTHNRTSFWKKWCTYVHACGIDPYLQCVFFGAIIENVSGFAGRVREGNLGRGHRVSCSRVQTAVRVIGQTCELEKGYNSLYRAPEIYLKPLELMLSGFTKEDKLLVPQITVPVVVPQQMVMVGMAKEATPKEQAVGYLGLIAFFYLLHIGEYTQKRSAQQLAPSNFVLGTWPSKKGMPLFLEMHQWRISCRRWGARSGSATKKMAPMEL